jgi:hypothetical protein
VNGGSSSEGEIDESMSAGSLSRRRGLPIGGAVYRVPAEDCGYVDCGYSSCPLRRWICG